MKKGHYRECDWSNWHSVIVLSVRVWFNARHDVIRIHGQISTDSWHSQTTVLNSFEVQFMSSRWLWYLTSLLNK